MKEPQATFANHVVLFADIHEFSWIVGTLRRRGQLMSQFLQEVYQELGDVIVEHGGEILKYAGDGILSLFSADSETDAVRCALEMRRAFSAMVHRWQIAHDTELEVGIGAGKVRVGLFGHPSHLQRDAVGEAVHHAAVIGHHRGIAITESVYDKVAGTYRTRKLPDLEAGWLEGPLKVWEITEDAP